MKIIYRISDSGYKKNKPCYINNENCLKNFTKIFFKYKNDITIIADNICNTTYNMISQYIDKKHISLVSVGHGAGTFNLALDQALSFNNNDMVYFVENDYLHKKNADKILLEGFKLNPSFITLYDHPDKYMDPSHGGNPYCAGGAENTRVYITDSCHWKITNSTTMTFASKVSTIKSTENILRKWTSEKHPHDFDMFIDLAKNNHVLISPIPGYSTHGETNWMCPLTDWSSI